MAGLKFSDSYAAVEELILRSHGGVDGGRRHSKKWRLLGRIAGPKRVLLPSWSWTLHAASDADLALLRKNVGWTVQKSDR